MKNIFFKYFVLMITFTVILSGCIEEKEVQGPIIPPPPEGNSYPNVQNPTSLNGTYQVTEFKNVSGNENLDIFSLQGIYNLEYDPLNNIISGTYALEYAGYSSTGELVRNDNPTQIEIASVSTYKDIHDISFNPPIELQINGQNLEILKLKKLDDNITDINNITLDEINNIVSVKLCDPTFSGLGDMNCSDPLGAVKYIGYYRVEEITCNNRTYKGGIDTFAGEMTANANVGAQVQIPIKLKFQVKKNNTELVNCLFNTSDTNTNPNYTDVEQLYHFSDNTFTVPLDAASDLGGTFSQLGLIGIKEGDNITRTTTLLYSPKNNDGEWNSEEKPYTDKLFNNNIITMKLKIMQQWGLTSSDSISVKNLDNSTYINQADTIQ